MSSRTLVLAGVLIAASLHGAAILHKTCWEHDETISYLAATGNQARYERALSDSSMIGAWTPAARWKSLFAIDRPFEFSRIGGDLARYDVHPPLYFWLLHVWVLVFGVNVWAGPLLNAVITAATGFALFRLARNVTAHRDAAALVLFLWLVSPIYRVAGDARQYSLLALWSVLLFGQTVRAMFGARARLGGDSALIAAIVACGFLTHYHFAIPLAACGLLVGIGRARARPIAILATGALAGVALFAMLHPRFLDAFQSVVPSEQPFTLSNFRYRITHLPVAIATFFIERQTAAWLLHNLAAFGALAGVVVVAAARLAKLNAARAPALAADSSRPEGESGEAARTNAPDRLRAVAILLASVFAGFASLYLLQITPMHAMGARYLSPLWPLFCFAPVLAPRARRRSLAFLVSALAIGLAVSSGIGAWLGAPSDFPLARWLAPPPAALVSDTAARGVFPRVFMLLPDDCAVLVASQETLARIVDARPIDERIARDGVYFSSLRHAGTQGGRDALAARLGASCAPERSEELDGLGVLYRWRCP
ncbi:MAG: glycosyltransferase family 39 protein [bacterium]